MIMNKLESKQVATELREESKDLEKKILRMNNLLNPEIIVRTIDFYGSTQVSLMRIQRDLMKTYDGLLTERIDDLEKDELMEELTKELEEEDKE